MTAFEDFVNLELPRRRTLLTLGNTGGYDGDPNDVAAPAIIQGAPLGTWFRENTAGIWWTKTETVWEETGAGGASVPSLMYQPGNGANGAGVFENWADLYTALLAIRAAAGGDVYIEIAIDDNFVTPAIIPAGTWDMTNVNIVAAVKPPLSGLTFLHLAEGCFLPNCRRMGGTTASLIVRNASTTTIPINITEGFALFQNEGAFLESLSGSPPMIQYNGPAAGFFLVNTTDFGNWGQNGSTPVIDMPVAGSTLFTNSTNGGFWPRSLSGVLGTVLIEQGGTELWIVSPQVLFLGTQSRANLAGGTGPSKALFGSAAAPLTATPSGANRRNRQGLYYFDVSGGPVNFLAESLVATARASGEGNSMTLVETSGTAGLTLSVLAGQTLNGVDGGSFPVPPGGSITFTNDDVDGYNVIAVYDPNLTRQQLTWEPLSGGIGPGVFATWTDVYAAIEGIRLGAGGNVSVTVTVNAISQNPDADQAVITARVAPYDMTGVKIDGYGDFATNRVDIADGATFTNLREFGKNLGVVNLNTTDPADDSLANNSSIQIGFNTWVNSAPGAEPIWSGANMNPGDFAQITLEDFSSLNFNNGTSPNGGVILDIAVAGTFVGLGGQGATSLSTADGAVTGDPGSLLVIIAGNMRSVPPFSTYPGTVFSQQIREPASLRHQPYFAAPSTAPLTVTPGDWCRFNTTAGDISCNLHNTGGFATLSGVFAMVTNAIGGNNVLLNRQGTDTINGSTAAFRVRPGETVLLMNDGIGEYRAIVILARPIVDIAASAVTPATLATNTVRRFDTTGGNIVANLPAANSVANGDWVDVKNETGGNSVDVTPAGADAIDGVAALSGVAAGVGSRFYSDGVANWTRI